MTRLLPLLLLALLASSCRYTSFPLIPAQLSGSFPSRFESAGLRVQGSDLVLEVTLRSSESGYLGVLWFEDDRAVGQDTAYLDAEVKQATFRLPRKPGTPYRANLIFRGDVVRQFEYEPPASSPPTPPAAPASPR